LYSKYFKSLFDFAVAFTAIVLLFPIITLLFILLTIANQGSPFFLQERPGKNNRIFKVIKFRTMNNRRDQEGILLPDPLRLTTMGKFVRSTSLDELPQLFNVLKGEMSLIGPRPLLVKYLPLYSETQNRRHEVRPGITGWAQVNGRNAIAWKQKFELDVWYVDNVSTTLDLKILMLTLKKVLIREGISSDTTATMEPFIGNN